MQPKHPKSECAGLPRDVLAAHQRRLAQLHRWMVVEQQDLETAVGKCSCAWCRAFVRAMLASLKDAALMVNSAATAIADTTGQDAPAAGAGQSAGGL
jgi:hypothetical protein